MSAGFGSLVLARWSLIVVPSASMAASAAAVVKFAPSDFPKWYTEHLRTDFFNGSLTMAGFLFTVATFIVTGVKSGIYDSKAYRNRFVQMRALNPKLILYEPLRQLTSLLVAATGGCLVCATAHVLFGFCDGRWATAVCVASAVGSASVVLLAMLAARENFMDWLSFDEGKDVPP